MGQKANVINFPRGQFNIRKSEDIELVKRLHKKILPEDEFPETNGELYAWIVWQSNHPVGFCLISLLDDDVAYLLESGLVRSARGYGLQKRMIRQRIHFARKWGFKNFITYTSKDNYASMKSLMDCGFRLYDPGWRWVGDGFNYFYLFF